MEELKNKLNKKAKIINKSSSDPKRASKPLEAGLKKKSDKESKIEESTSKAARKSKKISNSVTDKTKKAVSDLAGSTKKATSYIVGTIKKVASNIAGTTKKVAIGVAGETKKVTSEIAEKTKEVAPDIADKTKKFATTFAEKAGETLNRGKLQTRLFDLKNKLKKKSAELGGVSFDLLQDKKTTDIFKDEKVIVLLTEMKELKSQIKKTEEDFKKI